MWRISASLVIRGQLSPFQVFYTGTKDEALRQCMTYARQLGGYLLDINIRPAKFNGSGEFQLCLGD